MKGVPEMVLQVQPDDPSDIVAQLQAFFPSLIVGKGLVPTVVSMNGTYNVLMPNLSEDSIPNDMIANILTENLQTEVELEVEMDMETDTQRIRLLQVALELAKAVNHALRSEKLLRWLEGRYEMHPHDPDAKRFKKPE